MAWAELGCALLAFLLTHAIPVRPPMRPWLVARLGPRGFTMVYSVLSLAVFWWLVSSVGRAPVIPLWPASALQSGFASVGVLLACLVFALSIGVPNPFSFGGGDSGRYDPEAPGVVRLTRHPLLLALALWAGAHVLANGDLAHVLLFGLFCGFSVLGGLGLDKRRRREMGRDWFRIEARRRAARFTVVQRGAAALRLGLGAALFFCLWALHGPVIGVTPVP